MLGGLWIVYSRSLLVATLTMHHMLILLDRPSRNIDITKLMHPRFWRALQSAEKWQAFSPALKRGKIIFLYSEPDRTSALLTDTGLHEGIEKLSRCTASQHFDVLSPIMSERENN